MKKILFVAMLTVVLVMLMGAAAFAFTVPPLTGYKAQAEGDPNPHNGFATTTQNCAVCHAVHNAAYLDVDTNPTELLLQSSVADACLACHVSGNTGWVVVYDNDPTLYTDAGFVGHDENEAACTECHQVHSASDAMVASNEPGADYLSAKILSTGDPFTASFDAADAPADSVSKWCTRCHNLYYTTAYNGRETNGVDSMASHVMTTAKTAGDGGYTNTAAVASVQGTQIAKYGSSTCYACHNDAEINLAGEGGTPLAAPMPDSSGYAYAGNFPHSSPGFRFLYSAQDDANTLAKTNAVGATWGDDTTHYTDGACLYCHANTDGAGAGVHKSF